jgi:HAD superfamily hydrolase (TIGR01490 family)
MKKPIAVFDIDGTIFRSSLIIELVDALILEGIFPQSARKHYAKEYGRWLERRDSYDKYIMGVVRAYVKNIKGKSQPKVWEVSRRVMAFHQNRVYRWTRDLVKDLKKKNYFLIAISNSPLDIVQPFARSFGFDKTYGRVYEIDGRSRFTGKIVFLDLISDKAKILKRALLKEDLTLRRSIGVGDSESDIPFLKMMERPVAFNPNSVLYKYAKRAGWEIVVERKDVIYKL